MTVAVTWLQTQPFGASTCMLREDGDSAKVKPSLLPALTGTLEERLSIQLVAV